MIFDNLKPANVWKNFYALTQIPRPSKHEEKVVKYLKEFGEKLGLETIQDEVGNIIIRKPATPGMENRMGIILQGHVDMVPQNNNDTPHDWLKDPVVPRIEDGWVWATGTTLGADNGLGCAVAMAVLEDKEMVHGPVEALFTIDEETGMTGANALKPGILKGDILINLDSETEGELYVGCAGGLDANITMKYNEEAVPAGYEALRIDIKGLKGGHSGMEINTGRANSNKLMVRFLMPLMRDFGARLASIEGGNMRNAIPREAHAVIALPAAKVAEAKEFVSALANTIKAEYESVETEAEFIVAAAQVQKVMDQDSAMRIVRAILACPNGVDRMSLEMEGLVETSNNLAIVKSENGQVSVKTLMRGSIDSAKEAMSESIRAAFELAGADVVFSGGYSGWKPNMKSPILKAMRETYNALYGKMPEVKAIHAGLECGILSGAYPHWDMISCGPTICSPHSPAERVEIASVEKWWNFVKATLQNAPVK